MITVALLLSGAVGTVLAIHLYEFAKMRSVEKANLELCFKSLEVEINDIKCRLVNLEESKRQ